MKRFITLAAILLTTLASAQTADQFIAAGRNALTLTNWWSADTNFSRALALSPANKDANALKAVTRLLVLPQTPAGSNFLVTLGFPKTNRWLPGFPLASLPKDTNGNPIFPANYNSSIVVSFIRSDFLTAITNSATNLAAITDPSYTLSLSPAETLTESVTVDYGDIQLLRAMLSAAQFFSYTLNANNCGVVLPQVEAAMQSGTLTYQWLLTTYPSLLTLANPSDLAASKGALTNTIALYIAASDFIRNVRPLATNRLFNWDPNDTANAADEAQFRATLTNVLLSLNGPVEFSPDNANPLPSTAYIGAWFTGAHSLRSLMPQFNGDIYINNSLPDYTFGGIIPYWPAFQTEAQLRNKFFSYAGIYLGEGGLQDDQYYYGSGSFAVFVNANQQATLVGFDTGDGLPDDGTAFGIYLSFAVDKHGNWQFSSNGVSGYGSFGQDGWFYGEVDGLTNVTGQTVTVWLNGYQQKPVGPFQNSAGYYSGTTSSADDPKLFGILAADGELLFCPLRPNGSPDTGGWAQFGSNNQFTTTNATETVISGTLNPSTFTIAGNFSYPGGGGTWSLSRSATVPFDVPPVITRDLLLSTNVVLGTNVSFSITVTGSPPMSYQWYLNGEAIPGAMTNTLIVSNLWSAPGTYYLSAAINNVASGTNSQTCTVNVGPEPFPPTVAITNITSGMLVSNAAFSVMGKAGDNVAVSSVWVSVNSATAFASGSTLNNWTNWSAPVTLMAGTNTIRAYAVNTSGVHSATNSTTIVYVVSAPLTVWTNGLGAISPNYNGTLLQLGVAYTMTASPGSGFVFTNWTGGTSLPLAWLTNGTTVRFLMQSNLVLQANFVDITKPILSITNLIAGQRVSNAVFVVRGTASDNWQVGNVLYQINGGIWNSATNINNWTSWAAGVTLLPGTNTVAVYAVDTTGNRSTTNSLSIQYVVSTPLQVQMAGLGTLNPNYSNAVLAVGQTYSMTASPGSGFVFTNWTGGTSLPLGWLTNGVTVQFLMQSNLILQANFVDITKPTLSITNLVAGQRVSNAVFTVRGTASDNWQVGNVAYQLNGGTWSNALSANNWTNWAGNVNLLPGTNSVLAYATDTTGNRSTTNSVAFQFVVTNQLGVRATGLGTVSPNYSNAWLEVGRNYAMTASPGSGFVVTNWILSTNWIGGTATNSAVVQFMMASNLTLQINFLDITKPTVTVSTPTAGQRMTNALASLVGTAADNWKVAGVWYQLNSNAWDLVATTNGYTNWNRTVTLLAGTNTLKVYAVDLGGNCSATNSFSVVSSNAFNLQLTFAAGQPLGNNGLNFLLQVSTNVNGRILVSTDLVSWMTLTNFIGTNATLNFRDAAATNFNQRFYRAVTP